jgi:uncharacterized protein YceK
MKNDLTKWGIFLLFLSLFSVGCSSIRARTATFNDEWTVYPGVQQDVKEIGEIFGGERPDPTWINGLVTSILIVDLPFSAIFDTLVAPYDVYRIYTPKGSGETLESSTAPSEQQARETEYEQ